MSEVRACNISAMSVLCTEDNDILFQIDRLMSMQPEDPIALIRTGSRMACEERNNLAVDDFTTASIGLPAAADPRFF